MSKSGEGAACGSNVGDFWAQDAVNVLLQLYVFHLIATNQHEHVPLYCCHMRVDARHEVIPFPAYSAFSDPQLFREGRMLMSVPFCGCRAVCAFASYPIHVHRHVHTQREGGVERDTRTHACTRVHVQAHHHLMEFALLTATVLVCRTRAGPPPPVSPRVCARACAKGKETQKVYVQTMHCTPVACSLYRQGNPNSACCSLTKHSS